MKKLLIILACLGLASLSNLCFAYMPKGCKNICLKEVNVEYCKNIGKYAYNDEEHPPLLRGVKLGEIIGVTWRRKGQLISISDAIPKARIPREIRRSKKDAYYYIIDDGANKPFLRLCEEIEAREE